MRDLGKKIVVVGVSASGKSTFARALERKVHLPLTLMDSVMWNPGWNYIGDTETVKKLEELSSKPEWIIEGYISTAARTFVLDRSDTILYLNYSSFVTAWRYVKRWWKHRKDPRPELEGCPETFKLSFLKRVFMKAETKTLMPLLKNTSNQSKLIVFTSPSDAERFLESL